MKMEVNLLHLSLFPVQNATVDPLSLSFLPTNKNEKNFGFTTKHIYLIH